MLPKSSVPLVKIGVLGVGGAGNNAINMMIAESQRVAAEGKTTSIFNEVKIIAANTDVQDLENSPAQHKVQLGTNSTKGQGAGSDSAAGRKAAEESKIDIAQSLEGLDMLFITAGMGGGTGTGASPVIASVARDAGVLTVGIVTRPFSFEGRKKAQKADEGIENLKKCVDTLVVIPNEKLIAMAEPTDGSKEMFQKSNIVLLDAVRNIAELISHKSFINVDFADIRTIMTNMGVAMIGFGTATGENAALNAVKEALSNPLLSDISIKGAKRSLLHFGGMNIPLKELTEAAEHVTKQLNEDADFIWGASADDASDKVFVLIVAEAMKEKEFVKTNVTKEQATLFQMPEKAQNNKVKEIANVLSEEESVEIEIEPAEALRPAAVNASASKMAKNNAPEKINYDEDIIFQLPDDADIDPNDKSIPAYLRKNAQATKALGKQPVDTLIKNNDVDSLEKFISSEKASTSWFGKKKKEEN